jgi:predicted kinase
VRARVGQNPGVSGSLIIVSGLPGSGKTTRATRLAAERGGVRLSPDDWMDALGVNLWDTAMRARVEALQWVLAKDMLRAGVTVVIEWGTWSRAERDTLRIEARELGASVELVYLDVPVDELWRRIQERGREEPTITRTDLEVWSRDFERPTEEEMGLYNG